MDVTPLCSACTMTAHQLRATLLSVLLCSAGASTACDYPDEGNMPLRRALTSVQMLPETDAWRRERRDAGDAVQFRLLLEETVFVRKRCYWTVEALAEAGLWRRFYVSPDGKSVLREKEGRRKEARPPRESTATTP